MKKAKAPKVPVLEQSFELNLPKLMRAAKAAGSGRLIVNDGEAQTVVLLSKTRLAAFLGGRAWAADIVAVTCLGVRLRPLLKCPRAHEGNFQSLYYWSGELACRHCHGLRYRSTLAASATARARLARFKLLKEMGAKPGEAVPDRQPHQWRRRHNRMTAKLAGLTSVDYQAIRTWLARQPTRT